MANVRYEFRNGDVITIHKVVIFEHEAMWLDPVEPGHQTIFNLWSKTPGFEFIKDHLEKTPEIISMPPDYVTNFKKYAIVVEVQERYLSEYYMRFK